MQYSNVETHAQNSFGSLKFCRECKYFTLTFSNFEFKFDRSKLKKFANYLNDVCEDYWLDNDTAENKKRPIPIHTSQQNLTLVFDRREFGALKQLVTTNYAETKFLSILDIDYPLILN